MWTFGQNQWQEGHYCICRWGLGLGSCMPLMWTWVSPSGSPSQAVHETCERKAAQNWVRQERNALTGSGLIWKMAPKKIAGCWKKNGHHFANKEVSRMLLWTWRQSVSPCSPEDMMTELVKLLKLVECLPSKKTNSLGPFEKPQNWLLLPMEKRCEGSLTNGTVACKGKKQLMHSPQWNCAEKRLDDVSVLHLLTAGCEPGT